MNKKQWERLRPGDKVVASDIEAQPQMLWHPTPFRPKLGRTYIVTGISEPPYQDIEVDGLPGSWARERFIIK